jgi:hypothetical protein
VMSPACLAPWTSQAWTAGEPVLECGAVQTESLETLAHRLQGEQRLNDVEGDSSRSFDHGPILPHPRDARSGIPGDDSIGFDALMK